MMKSMQPEEFKHSLYEAFLIPRKEIEKQMSSQNAVIGFILGCLLVGGIILLCVIVL